MSVNLLKPFWDQGGGGHTVPPRPNNKQRMQAEQYFAERQQAQATTGRTTTENTLKAEESMLGTDAQLSPYSGPSQELLPYLGRYQVEQGGLGSVYAYDPSKKNNKYATRLNANLTSANTLLGQAEQAARAGNFDQAAQLKAQADSALTNMGDKKNWFWAVSNAEQLKTLFNYVGPDSSTQAKAQLASPLAQTVGQSVKDARAFQDWDSPESVQQRKLLTEGGDRALAASEREGFRQERMQRMAMGGIGMQAGQARMMDERARAGYATQRAQLHSEADNQFLNWSREYAKNATGFAQSFLQNQAGIRDQYQASLDTLKANLSQMATQFSQQYTQLTLAGFNAKAQSSMQKSSEDAAFKRQLMTAVLAVGAGMATGGVGAAAVLGTAAATQPRPAG